MFSKEMEALIQATLEDGMLEENEKAALVKRAQKEGIDLDELEIYINSLLQKRQRELNIKNKEAKEAQAQADLEYEKKRAKELRKCPKCGSFIPQLSTVCPECGHIIHKNETDEKMVFLIKVLRINLQRIIDDGKYSKWRYADNIPRNDYDSFINLIDHVDGLNDKKPTVKVLYNFSAAMAEAYLYKDNDAIRKVLDQIEDAQRKNERLLNKTKKGVANIFDGWGGCLFAFGPLILMIIGINLFLKCQDDKFQDFSEKVTEYVTADNLTEAKLLLLNDQTGLDGDNIEKYDVLYLNMIRAFIKHEDFDSAEELGLMLRSKSSSSAWEKSSARQFIISTFKESGRDYSSFLTDDEKEAESNNSTPNDNSED